MHDDGTLAGTRGKIHAAEIHREGDATTTNEDS